MILDTIDNFEHYFHGLHGMEEFLSSLNADTPEGRHEIDEENVFAMVSRYRSRPRTECQPESHQRYADVQLLLGGQEIIEWFPLNGMSVTAPYDPDSDVAFYALPKVIGTQVALSKGMFAVFFPHDAHMPQIQAPEGSANIIKVVIKIKSDLL